MACELLGGRGLLRRKTTDDVSLRKLFLFFFVEALIKRMDEYIYMLYRSFLNHPTPPARLLREECKLQCDVSSHCSVIKFFV